jgi:hypothetical protein
MRAHSSGRVTSFMTMREMQCAGVRSYILQWAMPCVPSSRKTYPCQKRPDIHAWVKPDLHNHSDCGPRFHPLLHNSYIRDYWLAPFVHMTKMFSSSVSLKFYLQQCNNTQAVILSSVLSVIWYWHSMVRPVWPSSVITIIRSKTE